MKCSTLFAAVALVLLPLQVAGADCATPNFDGTFALIQSAIFERHSCTDQLCHGAASSGYLRLDGGSAYTNLIDVDATTAPGYQRVRPGDKTHSLLFVNLAAKTDPQHWRAPLRGMPLDPLPAVSPAELELVRLWIEGGAPATGTVPGTEHFSDACLPAPEPIDIKPLPPPADGVQFQIPTTTIAPHSEHELCFVQYYDIGAQVPPEQRSADGTRLRYRRSESRQTPMSHHLVMSVYRGETPPESSVWGEFVCWGGARDGQACNRFASDCGAGVVCATRPTRSIGCIGVGPADAGFGVNMMGDGGAGETSSRVDFPDGVYDELPLQGMILWNTHAFNLTERTADINAWINFEFAPVETQRTRVERITNTEQIFKMHAPAFGTDEVCHTQVLPPRAHLFMLSSHTHRRGKRFRIFRGKFHCDGGRHNGEACSPFGADFDSAEICAGAPCIATQRAHVSDCDEDGTVTIDEIIRALNIALGDAPMVTCPEADSNEDRGVAVDDLVAAVNAALSGRPPLRPRTADDSLLYVSLIYNDPLVDYFDPPIVFPSEGSDPADRTLTFCALYDNGYTNPDEVKTRASSPRPLSPAIPGGPCVVPTNCTAGRRGEACQGVNERSRNRSCDSTADAGDGFCDACPAVGGVTTEDEMLVLIGQYYVP